MANSLLLNWQNVCTPIILYTDWTLRDGSNWARFWSFQRIVLSVIFLLLFIYIFILADHFFLSIIVYDNYTLILFYNFVWFYSSVFFFKYICFLF